MARRCSERNCEKLALLLVHTTWSRRNTYIEQRSLNAGAVRLEGLILEHQIPRAVSGNGGNPLQQLEDFLDINLATGSSKSEAGVVTGAFSMNVYSLKPPNSSPSSTTILSWSSS
jgi:hypothetical protein